MRIERDLRRLDEHFDVVVIGGGITGVNVAREAAGRGLATLLIDKGDFGSGTSSATSKFIHGGIRYLETYEFRVVRESLRERRVLALSAPHLVAQTRFVMPAWKWSKPGALLIGAGVALYDLLSFDRNRSAPPSLRIPHPRWLSRRKVRATVPWLNGEQLRGAWAYHDTFNLHPERLLLAYLKDAVQCGGVALNHVRADGFVFETLEHEADGAAKVTGVSVTDALSGKGYIVKAKTVVNAAGPWMDLVLAETGRSMGVSVRRSKGVHIMTPPLGGAPTADAVFARAPSGRHVIVSSWMGRSFIGPTDTHINDLPDDVRAVQSDVDDLLETVNATLGSSVAPLSRDDVITTTVGIRPLIVEDGADSYHTSRRHELYDHAKGAGPTKLVNLWSIGGGKWTTGRATGEETVRTLLKSSALRGVRTRSFDTRRRPAAGAFGWAQDAERYLRSAASSRPGLGLDHDVRLHLARIYGTEHERILDLVEADASLGQRVSSRDGCLDVLAQAVFAVADEGAQTLGDVLDRRMILGTLGPVGDDEIRRVSAVVAPLLGRSAIVMADEEIERRRSVIDARRG